MTPEQFSEWVSAAEPGDAMVYYRGFNLLSDTVLSGNGPERETAIERRPPLPLKQPVATAAMKACESGLVLLVQRRVASAGMFRAPFEYVAVRSSST